MTQVQDFPLVDMAGAPRSRGRIHGETARGRVAASVDLYRGQLGRHGFDAARLHELTGDLAARIAAWQPDYIEEMEGIAEGAGFALQDILLINARTEIIEMARRIARGLPAVEPDGCTGVVVLPEASATGDLIHAQTWDWLAPCADTAVVLRIRGGTGPDILTFTEAGGLARNGFNSEGIAITANYLESDRDYRRIGIPLALIRRRVLEQRHLSEAIRTVVATPKSTSNNMIVSSVEGFAVDLECAPDEVFPLMPDRGLIVHSNHWQSGVALAKLREEGLRNMPDSLYRDWRVRGHLAPLIGEIGRDDVRAALSDRFGAPHAVCRAPLPEETGNLGATVATVMFHPAEGRMEVTPLPAINDRTTTYLLDMSETARIRAASANPRRAAPR